MRLPAPPAMEDRLYGCLLEVADQVPPGIREVHGGALGVLVGNDITVLGELPGLCAQPKEEGFANGEVAHLALDMFFLGFDRAWEPVLRPTHRLGRGRSPTRTSAA